MKASSFLKFSFPERLVNTSLCYDASGLPSRSTFDIKMSGLLESHQQGFRLVDIPVIAVSAAESPRTLMRGGNASVMLTFHTCDIARVEARRMENSQ